jgi:serine/threonine protein kinase
MFSRANIMLAEGVERVLLTDFGLARAADDAALTRTACGWHAAVHVAGTVRASPDDMRSDLFSLGSVLYASCAGGRRSAPNRASASSA